MAACAALRAAGARRVLADGPQGFLGPLGFAPAGGRMARDLGDLAAAGAGQEPQ
jgi:hypothetical protein